MPEEGDEHFQIKVSPLWTSAPSHHLVWTSAPPHHLV